MLPWLSSHSPPKIAIVIWLWSSYSQGGDGKMDKISRSRGLSEIPSARYYVVLVLCVQETGTDWQLIQKPILWAYIQMRSQSVSIVHGYEFEFQHHVHIEFTGVVICESMFHYCLHYEKHHALVWHNQMLCLGVCWSILIKFTCTINWQFFKSNFF